MSSILTLEPLRIYIIAGLKRSCKCIEMKDMFSFMEMCCNSNLLFFHYSYQIIDPHEVERGGGKYLQVA